MRSRTITISPARWASKLYGLESAKSFVANYSHLIKEDRTIIINMAGVKDISQGWAGEVFGRFYTIAKSKGSRIQFQNTKKHLKPVILKAIQNNIK